jgi:hypothetical protein
MMDEGRVMREGGRKKIKDKNLFSISILHPSSFILHACFLIFGFWSVLLCPNHCYAAADKPVAVTAKVNNKTVVVGDKINYVIAVKTKSGIEVEFPAVKEKLGDFFVKDHRDSQNEIFGRKNIERRYSLQSFTPGKVVVPKVILKYKDKAGVSGEAETELIPIEVKSVLGKDAENAEIKDIKGPIGLFNKIPVLILLIIILAVIAGFIWLNFGKKGRAQTATIETRRPAHEIAYEALDELRGKALVRAGLIKEFYTQRRYLEDLFNIHAPEMTTEEFFIKVKEENSVSYEHRSILKEFLSHCDLVKFAKYGPSPEEIEASFVLAKKFINQTKEVITSLDIEVGSSGKT